MFPGRGKLWSKRAKESRGMARVIGGNHCGSQIGPQREYRVQEEVARVHGGGGHVQVGGAYPITNYEQP